MTTFELKTPMPVDATTLYDWHARPGAFARLTPPWERAELVASTGPWQDGTQWTIRSRVFGLKLDWIAELHGIVAGEKFEDRQLKGPFAAWNHVHRFTGGMMHDRAEYRLPLAPFSGVMAGSVKRRLTQMFDYRHTLLAEDLKRHDEFKQKKRLHIAVTGSRGLIGRELTAFLTSGGHRVLRLISGKFDAPTFDDGTTWQAWNPQEPLKEGTLKGVDAVIHLAGDGIADGRWTAAKKQRLHDSRIPPTRHLAAAVTRDHVPIFLSGSAIGIYGDRGDEVLSEESAAGSGFLADLAKAWEDAAKCEARTVLLRTGIVLSPKGGALAKQLPAFKAGGGAVLGRGTQFTSWIDIQDMVYAIHHLMMTDTCAGPFNLVAPHAVTNRVFGRTLAAVLGRPYLLTVPRLVLKAMFGEMADAALLASTHAVPIKLQKAGYRFWRPDLDASLRTMLGR